MSSLWQWIVRGNKRDNPPRILAHIRLRRMWEGMSGAEIDENMSYDDFPEAPFSEDEDGDEGNTFHNMDDATTEECNEDDAEQPYPDWSLLIVEIWDHLIDVSLRIGITSKF